MPFFGMPTWFRISLRHYQLTTAPNHPLMYQNDPRQKKLSNVNYGSTDTKNYRLISTLAMISQLYWHS